MTTETATTRRRRSKPVQLLTKIVAEGWFDVKGLSTELVVDERTIAEYIAGDIDMPLERQLCLAQFIIDNVPQLARGGHNLLSQVRSTIRFKDADTTVHQTAPLPNSRSF